MNAFPLDDAQLDNLSAEFRARSIQAAATGDFSASLAWEAAAGLLHAARLAAWDTAAAERAAAKNAAAIEHAAAKKTAATRLATSRA